MAATYCERIKSCKFHKQSISNEHITTCAKNFYCMKEITMYFIGQVFESEENTRENFFTTKCALLDENSYRCVGTNHDFDNFLFSFLSHASMRFLQVCTSFPMQVY